MIYIAYFVLIRAPQNTQYALSKACILFNKFDYYSSLIAISNPNSKLWANQE